MDQGSSKPHTASWVMNPLAGRYLIICVSYIRMESVCFWFSKIVSDHRPCNRWLAWWQTDLTNLVCDLMSYYRCILMGYNKWNGWVEGKARTAGATLELIGQMNRWLWSQSSPLSKWFEHSVCVQLRPCQLSPGDDRLDRCNPIKPS